MWVRSLAPLSGLGIRLCHELWCQSQMWLGSWVAVASMQASSCSSNSTPHVETSLFRRCGPKKKKQEKKYMWEENPNIWITELLFFFFFFLAAPRLMAFLARDQIWATVATYTSGATMPDPLTHCARSGSNLHPGAAEMPPILLHHSRNFTTIQLNHFAVQQKVSQHCKSTTVQ